MSDTDKTDVIPGLRDHDTPALGTPVHQGRHRVRRGLPMPRWATALVFGAPVAAVALAVGLLVPGWFSGGEPAPAAVSPSRAERTTVAPLPVLPSPTQSRADRSRPRTTRPELAPSPSTAPRSPSPTPRATSPHPTASSSPTRSSGSPSGSPSPTPTPTGIEIPPPLNPSHLEPTDDE